MSDDIATQTRTGVDAATRTGVDVDGMRTGTETETGDVDVDADIDVDAIDLTDPRTHAERDLTAFWRRLRDRHPVHRHRSVAGRPGFWVVTRHADILGVYRDSARFSSERGNVLATLLTGGDRAGGRMLPVTDGPRHAAMRSLMLPAFGPRALDRLTERIRTATRTLLREAIEAGACDFSADVASRIPLLAICELMGVPEGDRQHVLRLTNSALASPSSQPNDAAVLAIRSELLLYFGELSKARRAKAADDVVSMLVHDGRLTDDEVVLNCYSLVIGGDETTRLAMSGTVLALVRHPYEWQRLKDRSVAVASAVEEVLRWTTPPIHAGRTVTEDLVMHDVSMRVGDVVTVWNISGNRDEREFTRPDVLDLGRQPNRHLAFGYGRHFCLGAQLARVELATLIEALRDMVADIELLGAPPPLYSTFLSGCAALPVSLSPARRPPDAPMLSP